MNSNYLIYGIIIVLVILIVFSLVKKLIKLFIFILAIVVLYSAYSVFVKGVSPTDMLHTYNIDAKYATDVAEKSKQIKQSVDNIKAAIESKKMDVATREEIAKEDKNLHEYEGQIKLLEHSKKLDAFHNSYVDYVDKIVSTADSVKAMSGTINQKNIDAIGGVVEKFNKGVEELSKLKIQ